MIETSKVYVTVTIYWCKCWRTVSTGLRTDLGYPSKPAPLHATTRAVSNQGVLVCCKHHGTSLGLPMVSQCPYLRRQGSRLGLSGDHCSTSSSPTVGRRDALSGVARRMFGTSLSYEDHDCWTMMPARLSSDYGCYSSALELQ